MTASTYDPVMAQTATEPASSPGLQIIARMLQQLDSRLEELLRSEHFPDSTGLPLRESVITPSEVNALLSSRHGGPKGYQNGSLWAPVATDAAAARRAGIPIPVEVMRERFRLSAFETECVVACLAPELDSRYQKVYSCLNDDVTRRYPTAQVLVRLLSPAEDSLAWRKLLLPSSVLLRSGILVYGDDGPGPAGLNRGLQVETGVVQYLLEDFQASPSLQQVWHNAEFPSVGDSLVDPSYAAAIERQLARWFDARNSHRERLVCFLCGRSGSGQRQAAEQACLRAGLGLMPLDGRRLLRHRNPEVVLAHAFRDSLLHGAPLMISHFNTIAADHERGSDLRFTIERLMEDQGWILFLCAEEPGHWTTLFPRYRIAEVTFDAEPESKRLAWWQGMLTAHAGFAEWDAEAIAEELAARYRLTAGQTGLVFERAAADTGAAPEDWRNSLHRMAAEVSAPKLGEMAQKVRPSRGWTDLILPDHQKDLVADVIRQIQYRRTVFDTWSFREKRTRLQGVIALFSGPPGTGKSMAAEVIARSSRMDMYRIDLATVVSKYIGETEKNLARIFHESQHSDAILFFDEADALFGKRSEVKDAHDRYANIEINYLLQQLESFDGIAILATNLRQHLDDAFLRRVHTVVEFPMPSADDRLEIWRGCVPDNAPLADDTDLPWLAGRFDIAGGNISNVVLTAAFLAAEERSPISMGHLVRAMRRELDKIGKRSVPEEFGEYAKWLDVRTQGTPEEEPARAIAPELEMED